jgi:hypothetical protein
MLSLIRPITSRKMGWMEQLLVRMREIRNSYIIFVEKQRKEMALDDNIKVSVKKVRCEVWNIISWLKMGSHGRSHVSEGYVEQLSGCQHKIRSKCVGCI